MYLILPFLPFASSILAGFFGRFIGSRYASFATTFLIALTFCSALICFCNICLVGESVSIKLADWVSCGLFSINWGFLFDPLSISVICVVTGVSTLVHLYSSSYMSEDPHLCRFMSQLSLFTFFMVILVTSDNLVQLFLGWEGIGLTSYLLIGFWFTRVQANKAAIKAMLVNRIGDLGLALGIAATYVQFRCFDFATLFAVAPTASQEIIFFGQAFDSMTLICCLLFVGAVGKSAQIGLHTWLPDAIEGPTPVSALIHAATLVISGVFLICRCSSIFELSTQALTVITVFGGITALFAGATGLVQNDLKRVIAYSTCSQLGYIVFACGLSGYSVGVFHLANHAAFKALLFLSAGAVIHAIGNEQDMRRIGGLVSILPLSYSIILIGSLALMGFPFLTGFQSKDVILEMAFASQTVPGHFAWSLGTLAAACTAFYSTRLIFLTFLVTPSAHRNIIEHAHDAPVAMAVPLFILSFGAIFLGQVSKDLAIGLGSCFWQQSLFTLPSHMLFTEAEFIPQSIKLFPVFCALISAGLAFFLQSSCIDTLVRFKLSSIGVGF